MASASDLCTLDAFKAWVGQVSTDDDVLISRLITGASGLITSYLNRSAIVQKTFTEIFDGYGPRARIMLRNWPVVSVASVSVNGNALSQALLPAQNASPGTGYLLSDTWDGVPPGNTQELYFLNTAPPCGPQSVVVTYSAGYTVQNEAQTIPAAVDGAGNYRIDVSAPYGPWAGDGGVSFTGGAALTKVASAPAAGQYALDATPGGYKFAAADNGKAVSISYSFIPSAIQQACIEIAAERYKYKSRIGETTRTSAGMVTATFTNTDMTPYVAALLSSYIRVVPL